MKRFAIVKKEDPLSNLRCQQLINALSETMIYDENHPELVICIGGDGTIINAVHQYIHLLDSTYFVGIHTGTLGFYTDYNEDEWEVLVKDILHNEWRVDKRCLLKVECGNDVYYALNEMSLEESHCSLICDVYINGEYLECFRGNGLCISTPSGSTALNRSLGGSVVVASIPSMQLTEIAGIHHNAYRSLRSSLVLGSDSVVTLKPQMGRRMTLGVDRDVISYENKTEPVKVSVANRYACFIRFRHHGLCQRLRKAYISS